MITPLLTDIMTTLVPDISKVLPAWLIALVDAVIVVLLAYVTMNFVKLALKIASDVVSKTKGDVEGKRLKTASSIIISLARYIIWFVAITAIIGELGLESAMTSILAAAGIGGLLLSVGAQSLVKDVVTGVFMLFENQIAVGDFVEINSVKGTVTEITLRTTVVRGVKGELNTIPNGTITVLTNYSRENYTAIINIGIAYEADIDRALAIMLEEGNKYAAESDGDAFDAEIAGVTELGQSAVNLRMTLGVKPLCQFAAQNELIKRIKERFDREGIEIPYNRIVVINSEEK